MKTIQEVLSEMESGSVQPRSAPVDNFTAEDNGTFTGRAVPYGLEVELMPGLKEVFEPGAFARQVSSAHRIRIAYRHGEIVGRVLEMEDREDGPYIRAEIADDPDIPDGRKALALLRRKLVDELSVGFRQLKKGTRVEHTSDGSTLVRHFRAHMEEVSVVPWGAYGRGATVTSVRDAEAALAAEVASVEAERTARVRLLEQERRYLAGLRA